MSISVCPLACNSGVPIIILELYLYNRYFIVVICFKLRLPVGCNIK